MLFPLIVVLKISDIQVPRDKRGMEVWNWGIIGSKASGRQRGRVFQRAQQMGGQKRKKESMLKLIWTVNAAFDMQ